MHLSMRPRAWARNRRHLVYFLVFVTAVPVILYLQFLSGVDTQLAVLPNIRERFLRAEPKPLPRKIDLNTDVFNFIKRPQLNATCTGRQRCHSKQEARWRLWAVIKSSPRRFHRRATIRETWGSVRLVGELAFNFLFLMGSEDGNGTRMLTKERERYGDILQYDGPDKLKHVPIKSAVELQWASGHLSNSDLLLSTTDAIDMNPVQLYSYIKSTMNLTKHHKWPDFPMVCLSGRANSFLVSGDPKSRFYAASESFQWKTYPTSCSGGFFLTGGHIVKELYLQSRAIAPMRDGGVWVTGLLLRRTGMPDKMILEATENAAWRLSDLRATNATTRAQRRWKWTAELLKTVPHCLCV